MNCKAELFLDKYRKLEATVSARYNLSSSDSAVGYLERRPEYRAIKSELAYCREVRNLLAHNPKVKERYAVEPSDEMIDLLDQTVDRINNPLKARHICVPIIFVTKSGKKTEKLLGIISAWDIAGAD